MFSLFIFEVKRMSGDGVSVMLGDRFGVLNITTCLWFCLFVEARLSHDIMFFPGYSDSALSYLEGLFGLKGKNPTKPQKVKPLAGDLQPVKCFFL